MIRFDTYEEAVRFQHIQEDIYPYGKRGDFELKTCGFGLARDASTKVLSDCQAYSSVHKDADKIIFETAVVPIEKVLMEHIEKQDERIRQLEQCLMQYWFNRTEK